MNTQNEKERIARMIQELREETYVGIEKTYAPLLLDVIYENSKFEGELEKCVLDHNMLEDLLLTRDAHFLTNEFGRNLLGFPEGFVVACMRLYKQFQSDFPYANVVDTTKKNKIYGINYSLPKQYFYYMAEYDEPRNLLRELITKFTKALEIKAVPQGFIVVAENTSSQVFKYKLKISIYIGFKNDYPHIFESKTFSTPISKEALREIEACVTELSIVHQWKNEMDYEFSSYLKNGTLFSFAPQLQEDYEEDDHLFQLHSVPQRFLGVRYSYEIDDLPPIKNYYS